MTYFLVVGRFWDLFVDRIIESFSSSSDAQECNIVTLSF